MAESAYGEIGGTQPDYPLKIANLLLMLRSRIRRIQTGFGTPQINRFEERDHSSCPLCLVCLSPAAAVSDINDDAPRQGQ
ncbi:hypothetical protein EDF46_3588 [Frondihabitans sp. PhB188]|nr:hypothetical protein EDF46_3588 [Frondihabitans sp. PhB188]